MDIISLQSGSNGNSFYVETGGVRLLFDAGISGRSAEQRLASHGRDIREVDALFISHDHNDHSRSMGIFQRKYGMPIYVTRKTLAASMRNANLGRLADVRHFSAGQPERFGDVVVHSIPTPHDSADGVAFVVEHGEKRLGVLTDLGHVFDGLRDILLTLDAVVIESNYDRNMLAHGAYPEHLKRRIRGPRGHLSNDESATVISKTATFKRLQWACLCHLSEENNRPDLARRVHQNELEPDFPVHVASRYGVSDLMRVE